MSRSQVKHRFKRLGGFAGTFPAELVSALRTNADVDKIEEDVVVTASGRVGVMEGTGEEVIGIAVGGEGRPE